VLVIEGGVFGHRDGDLRVLVEGQILKHIGLIVKSGFSQGDDAEFGITVVDEGGESAPGRVKARVVGEALCCLGSATAAHEFGSNLLLKMKSELQFLVDEVQIEDGGADVAFLLKINDLFQFTQPIVPVCSDDPHCFVELDPQDSLLACRMEQSDHAIDIVLEEGIDSNKATLITLPEEEALIANANLLGRGMGMRLDEPFLEVDIFLDAF
jgi:hypothetical protein